MVDLLIYLDQVHAYVRRRIESREVAEDVTAEVFAAAIHAGGRHTEPLPWLYGIARRKVADSHRKRRIRKERPLDDANALAGDSAHDHVVARADAAAVRLLVDKLPDDEREAILLFYVEDLSSKQIGVAMVRSEKAVNSLLQRARARLRKSGLTSLLEVEN